jgi:hypothetical protein
MAAYTPAVADVYTIKYFHTQTQTDPILTNDTLTRNITITSNVFARDSGIIAGALGIGAGNGAYIGQSYTTTTPAFLLSITGTFNTGYVGEKYAFAIWNTNGAGTPTTIFATTDTLIYPNTNPLTATVPINGGSVSFPVGTYVVTAIEFDSTVQIATTNNIFTLGKMWVNWPTIPGGTWQNVEFFGNPVFEKPFVLRMNLGPTLIPLSFDEMVLKGNSTKNSNELTWTNNEIKNEKYEYKLERSTDMSTWNTIQVISSSAFKGIKNFNYSDENCLNVKNYYRVNVKSLSNKIKNSNTIELINLANKDKVTIYPNPAKEFITINTSNFENTYLTIINLEGKVLKNQLLKNTATFISLKDFAKGAYLIKLTNNRKLLFTDKLLLE